MFTLLYKPYRVKWFTKGEGGSKLSKNTFTQFVNVPLTGMSMSGVQFCPEIVPEKKENEMDDNEFLDEDMFE